MKRCREHLYSCCALQASALIASSIATAQVPAGLSKAEAAALDDQVNNVLRESGVLQTASAAELRSPIASTILFLVEEGTRVKKGDRLVTLDAAAIEQQLAIEKTKMAAGKADLIAAQSDLENRELALESVQLIGEKQIKVADMKLDLFRGEGGEYDTAQQDLADKLAVVEKQIAFAATALDEAKKLHGDSGSTAAVKHAEAALQAVRAESSVLKRARNLQERTRQIRIAELELGVVEQTTNLNTSTNTLRSEVNQAKIKLEAAKLAEEIGQSKLNSLLKKLEGAILYAPQDGVVLYPPRRRGAEMLEAGTTVREQQTLLTVADPNKLQVAVTVNETKIGRVQLGQNAVIHFDALIDRGFSGTVTQINDTPEPTTFLEDTGRQYRVIVSLRDPIPQLRIGMTAMVDIRTNN